VSEHRLIRQYHESLGAQLPRRLAEEVADGLDEANAKYLMRGLGPDEAARAAVAEFGDPADVVAEFSRSCPARKAAGQLLATGPAVGTCWAVALITGRAWDWPLPAVTPVLLGAMIAATVAVLLTAAVARRYRVVRRAGAAGCVALGVLDASAITAALLADPALRWPVMLAVAASTIRLGLVARAIQPVLA
jgi:hypothetical protein